MKHAGTPRRAFEAFEAAIAPAEASETLSKRLAGPLGGPTFRVSSYLTEQNKEVPCYEMDREGTFCSS